MEGLINRIPGSRNVKVAVGTGGFMLFLAATFFGPRQNKSGHNIMDVSKPESVQMQQDHSEQARLSRFARGSGSKDKGASGKEEGK